MFMLVSYTSGSSCTTTCPLSQHLCGTLHFHTCLQSLIRRLRRKWAVQRWGSLEGAGDYNGQRQAFEEAAAHTSA